MPGLNVFGSVTFSENPVTDKVSDVFDIDSFFGNVFLRYFMIEIDNPNCQVQGFMLLMLDDTEKVSYEVEDVKVLVFVNKIQLFDLFSVDEGDQMSDCELFDQRDLFICFKI